MTNFTRAVGRTIRGGASIFRERIYVAISVASSLVFLILYLLVPVWTVPGNTIAFELGLLTLVDYVLLGALALMTGVLLSLEVSALRRSRSNGLRSAGEGSIGLVASLAGGVLTAASCGCGLGILLGIVGLGGGAIFVATHQTAIVVGMLSVVAIGLYFSARRAAGLCATCSV